MPKFKFALVGGKSLTLEGDSQPSDADAEQAAKEAGVQLAPASPFDIGLSRAALAKANQQPLPLQPSFGSSFVQGVKEAGHGPWSPAATNVVTPGVRADANIVGTPSGAGVSPEDMLMLGQAGAHIATAVDTAAGIGGKALAAVRGTTGQVAPIVKYEVVRHGLGALGVPAPLASVVAMGVSGRRGGKAAAEPLSMSEQLGLPENSTAAQMESYPATPTPETTRQAMPVIPPPTQVSDVALAKKEFEPGRLPASTYKAILRANEAPAPVVSTPASGQPMTSDNPAFQKFAGTLPAAGASPQGRPVAAEELANPASQRYMSTQFQRNQPVVAAHQAMGELPGGPVPTHFEFEGSGPNYLNPPAGPSVGGELPKGRPLPPSPLTLVRAADPGIKLTAPEVSQGMQWLSEGVPAKVVMQRILSSRQMTRHFGLTP